MAYDQKSLDDYIDVAQRIADFREQYPDGSLQAHEPWRWVTVQGFEKNGDVAQQTFVVYVAAAYRTPDDPRPGIGVAWEVFPSRTPYTRGSELENAETSAWGRAIIAVGASDSKRGIASREEVRNRQAERELPIQPEPDPSRYCLVLSASGLFRCAMSPGHDGLHDYELSRNADGSLSRSRTTDEQKQAAGVMTAGQLKEHNRLAKPDPLAQPVDRDDQPSTDDRWTTDAPSWLVGVDPPEDEPGSILPAQRSQIMALYTALGIKDREARLLDVRNTLATGDGSTNAIESVNELSHRQAGVLLQALHDRQSGKMSKR